MITGTSAREGLRRTGIGVLGALVAGLTVLGVATPAHAAPGSGASPAGGKHWRFDASAMTVTDVSRVIGADLLGRAGITGAGVGVALIDTGVVPVPGLPADRTSSTARTCRSRARRQGCATPTPTATAPTWPASSPAPRTARASAASPRAPR